MLSELAIRKDLMERAVFRLGSERRGAFGHRNIEAEDILGASDEQRLWERK